MRPKVIIIARVGLHDVIKMFEAKAKEVIEAFPFEGADEQLDPLYRAFDKVTNDKANTITPEEQQALDKYMGNNPQ